MPLIDRWSRPSPRGRARQLGGAVALVALLMAGVSACGDDVEKATCGDLLDRTDSQQLDFVKQAVQEQANPDEKEDIRKSGAAKFYTAATKRIVSACDGKDDDTLLVDLVDDIDY